MALEDRDERRAFGNEAVGRSLAQRDARIAALVALVEGKDARIAELEAAVALTEERGARAFAARGPRQMELWA